MRSIKPVLAALAQARTRTAPLYASWCELNAERYLSANDDTASIGS
jgi:hypothetical protein